MAHDIAGPSLAALSSLNRPRKRPKGPTGAVDDFALVLALIGGRGGAVQLLRP
jgi:hypothetical protein